MVFVTDKYPYHISVRLTDDLHDKLGKLWYKEDRSKNEIMREALEMYWEAKEGEGK